MKKLIAIILILVMATLAFTLVACDAADKAADKAKQQEEEAKNETPATPGVVYYKIDEAGAQIIQTVPITAGMTILAVPAGYDGWYTDAACTQPFDNGATLTQTTLLYCKKSTQQPPVNPNVSYYKIDESTPGLIRTVSVTADFTLDPVPEGYDGWFTDVACTLRYENAALAADTALYCKKQPVAPNVIYYKVDDGSSELLYSVSVTEDFILATVEEGYVGWYTDADCTLLYDYAPVTQNIALYCKKETQPEELVVSEEKQAEMHAAIDAYLTNWVQIHAEPEGQITDQSAAFRTDIVVQNFNYIVNRKPVRPTVSVALYSVPESDSKRYVVTFAWADIPSYTKMVDAVTVHYGPWAGPSLTVDGVNVKELPEGVTAADALDTVLKASIHTVNLVTGEMSDGRFGVNAVAAVEVAGVTYGLHISGNINVYDAEYSEIGLELVNPETERVLFALYYDGSARRLYFRALDRIRYVEGADLSALLSKIPTNYDENGIWSYDEGKGLNAFLPDGVQGLVSQVINMFVQGYESNNGYIFDINIGNIIYQFSSLMSQMGIRVDDFIPEFLLETGLDVETMGGLLGHVTIAANLTADESTLTDLALAVNIPECTFRLNDRGNRIAIPAISAAISLTDFSFTEYGRIRNVIPAAVENASSFSLTDLDVGMDVYREDLDCTFRIRFASDIDLLDLLYNRADADVRVALQIKQCYGAYFDEYAAWNFLTLTYDYDEGLFMASGTAFGMNDGGESVYLVSTADALHAIETWFGLDNWQGIGYDAERGAYISDHQIAKESAIAVLDDPLVQELMAYVFEYVGAMDEGWEEAEPADAAADNGISRIEMMVAYVTSIKDFVNELLADGVIVIDRDEGSVKVDFDAEEIDKIVAFLEETFQVYPGWLVPLDEVNFYYNVENFEDKIFFHASYAGMAYAMMIDLSREGQFTVDSIFTHASGRTFTIHMDAEDIGAHEWNVRLYWENVRGDTVSLTLSNFYARLGDDTSEVLDDILESQRAKENGGDFFRADGSGPATRFVQSLLWTLNNDLIRKDFVWLAQWAFNQYVSRLY